MESIFFPILSHPICCEMRRQKHQNIPYIKPATIPQNEYRSFKLSNSSGNLASNTLFRRDCLNSRQVSSLRNNTCFEFLPLYAPQLNPSKCQQAACALHLHLHWTEHKPVHPSGAHVGGTCNVSCSGSGSGMGMAMLMAMSMMMMMTTTAVNHRSDFLRHGFSIHGQACARMSTNLPFPSSPHWAPRTTPGPWHWHRLSARCPLAITWSTVPTLPRLKMVNQNHRHLMAYGAPSNLQGRQQ